MLPRGVKEVFKLVLSIYYHLHACVSRKICGITTDVKFE